MLFKISLLFIATIFAFWISAICGGGASLILLPLLNILLHASEVPFALTVGTFTSSASRIVVFRKHICWKIFLWFVPFSIPAVLLGAWLMKYVNPIYLQLIVALFLMGNIPELFRTHRAQEKEERPYPVFVLALVGFFAGFVSGVTGAIGLLFNRFYLRYGLSKEQIVATRAANEVFLHLIKLVIYILLGLYSKNAFFLGIAIAGATIVSAYTVKYVLPYLSEYMFRKIGYGAMAVSGIFLFFSTSHHILMEDKISFGKNRYDETTMNWRNSNFALEFALSDGFEIERQINANELPDKYKRAYDSLQLKYNPIYIEKVYKLGDKRAFEFNCFRGDILYKIEIEEEDR
ncbi:MAG TPA: sulfite exporter TauE/SafE family protein [Chitinophagales bacterium]|nr:sulfite exporter TauE/SafE family protein [Chitinophagales bacterium]